MPHHRDRKLTRLSGYDYSQPGAYFVTVCTRERQCILGSVADGDVQWSQSGTIVWECWNELPGHYPHVELDAFIIMPNHVHGILAANQCVAATTGNSRLAKELLRSHHSR